MLDIKKFYFNNNDYLTLKEATCLYWYTSGKTIKETARILGLSNKTIESYLEKTKMKLGCHTKSELTNIILSQGIFEFFQRRLKINNP